MRGLLVTHTMRRCSTMGGGPGFDPHGLHIILTTIFNTVPRGSPCLGHVAPSNLSKNVPRVDK
jgi:hypothetical protein